MRTLLINTPYPFSEYPVIPMGLAYIAGVLRKEGIEVQVQDFLIQRYSEEKLREKIAAFAPEVVGITSVTMNYPTASEILRDCKKIDENIITVIGGPHVSFWVKETLREAPWIDIVVRGEGEYTMLEIARGKALKDIDGIAFRGNNGVTLTKPRQWIENLDELPLPARDLFPLSKHQALFNKCGLMTSRGCPFNCIFCVGHKMVGKKARFRNPKLVVDEIEELLDYGFDTINIVDDLLTLNRKHLYGICDEILARNLKFKWTAFSRVDTVNPELLHRMSETGCFFLCYGIESGNQKILDIAKKKITVEKSKQAVEWSKEAGISSFASFIIGLPGETKETLKETFDFAEELHTPYGFHLLSPFPGTEVREKAKEYGLRILTNNWLSYSANEAITETEEASAEDLNNVIRKYDAMIEDHNRRQKELEEKEGIGALGPEKLEEMKEKRRVDIAAFLLDRDFIEKLGIMKTRGDVIEELAVRASNETHYPPTYIKEGLTDIVRLGSLKYKVYDGKVVWDWA